jgi:hypothetical protein
MILDPLTGGETIRIGTSTYSRRQSVYILPKSKIMSEKIIAFVGKIVQRLMDEKQFLEANITLREIETIKKVLVEKLISRHR